MIAWGLLIFAAWWGWRCVHIGWVILIEPPPRDVLVDRIMRGVIGAAVAAAGVTMNVPLVAALYLWGRHFWSRWSGQ